MTDQTFNLALQRHQAGQLTEAEALYQQVLKHDPNHAEALHRLGILEYQKNRPNAALDLIQQAIRIDSTRPDFHANLGLALAALSRHPEAIDAYQRALSLRPDYPQALNNLGNSLRRTGKFEQAATALRAAINLRPDYFQAHDNLGSALRDARQYPAAIAAFQQALQLSPNYLPALRGLADALQDNGQLEQSIILYQRLLATHPPDADEIELALGGALKNIGRIEEAQTAFRRSLQLNPSSQGAASNLLFSLWYDPAHDAAAIGDQHRQWARSLRVSVQPHQNTRDPHRRLKIGYVSPDFRQHALSFFTLPLLSHHDSAAYEIYCYASIHRPDEITARFAAASQWCDCLAFSDDQLAEKIRADGIDLLIDLSLHTAGARPFLFAQKPAPIQIAYLAYTGTTGLQSIDYRLTDPHLDPPGQTDAFYSEKSIRLPETACCYDPLTDQPQPNSLPALTNGFITFGCLSSFCKINDRVLSLWSEVFHGIPDSRFLLRCPEGAPRAWVLKQLNVDPHRIEFIAHQPRHLYLQTYHRIDAVLDTLPYCGHTTGLDGLWMGVPMVNLIGRTVVGRAGFSQLINLGLPEFAAHDQAQFVRIAVELAADLPRLAKLRQTLRDRMRRSPVMDAPRFTRNVEAAYRQMWQDWCATH